MRDLKLSFYFKCKGHVTFTNLKCSFANKDFGEFTQCDIKAVNRTHKYIRIYEKLLLKPIDNLIVSLTTVFCCFSFILSTLQIIEKFLRYDYGYKPFFVDVTIDGCLFLKNQRHPIMNIFYRLFRDHSNINHTCPFNVSKEYIYCLFF